jgi:hypothetical protein
VKVKSKKVNQWEIGVLWLCKMTKVEQGLYCIRAKILIFILEGCLKSIQVQH